MTIELYHISGSAPCRSVRLVAAAIDVDLDLKFTNLMEKEHLKPEFLKMNPQHTVPTINDNGFYLWESHAICTYLANKYAKDDSLYPKDPQQRAVVDQRLYFDMGTLYKSYTDYYYPQFFYGQEADPVKYDKINEAFDFVEKFLESQNYIAGDKLTIADLVIATSVAQITAADYDVSKYPNTARWYNRIQSEFTKYKEISEDDLKAFKQGVEQLKKNPLKQ